jgi:hypothetical protein
MFLNMTDTSQLAVYVLIGALLFVACVMSYRQWGGTAYLVFKAFKKRSLSIPAIILLLIVSGVMLQKQGVEASLSTFYFNLKTPPQTRTVRIIAECKDFVRHAHTQTTDIDHYRRFNAGFVALQGPSYWELCAHTFGMNYWKYDISIDEKNGGYVLCDAYEQTPYQNERVRAWCQTVFSRDI